MASTVQARLVNAPGDDPCLFISFPYAGQAILFDVGDIHSLSPKDILKVDHVFITHTHMDHFIGFDHLLRLILGREKTIHFYGPDGFIQNIEGKLAGYSWNLVRDFKNTLIIKASEISAGRIKTKTYSCRDGFHPEEAVAVDCFCDTLHQGGSWSVQGIILDHDIPCLAYSLVERYRINFRRDSIEKLGLTVGPWLTGFKNKVFNGEDPQSQFMVKNVANNLVSFTLDELLHEIAIITPGRKITYITDVAYHRENKAKLVTFAKGADHLFIEAAFLDEDKKMALKKKHLTAGQAAYIARDAGVKKFSLFHHSPRYTGMFHRFRTEAEQVYRPPDLST
ncbi:MAG: ribonuclease Z [Desulfobacteraceae bacterium]|nr:ribonuclease Z [Desulfobacteraceae bacterium]